MPSSRNSAKAALLFFSLLLFTFFGCEANIEPTYKEQDIPYLVKKICKDEYNLEVTTKRVGSTLWIYAPMSKILHKDYGVAQDKIFDEEVIDKLRNILTTIGRVLISSDDTPNFFALLASDINIGIDYTLIGNVLDIKKSYAGFIPWPEANRRYVIRFKLSPNAISDTTGSHMVAYDISLPDFLAEQTAQRISGFFHEEEVKSYYTVEKSEGRFENGVFTFEYAIKQIAVSKKEIDVKKKVMEIITYCIQTYEFKDFSVVVITDLLRQDTVDLNRAAIWARPKD